MSTAILDNIDLPLLKAQKRTLLKILENSSFSKIEKAHIEGIVNLLDDIHDQLDPP